MISFPFTIKPRNPIFQTDEKKCGFETLENYIKWTLLKEGAPLKSLHLQSEMGSCAAMESKAFNVLWVLTLSVRRPSL